MSTIEIYTSPFCGFCHAAKRMLQSKGLSFVEYDVMQDPSKRTEMLQRANGRHTVPQIFVGAHHIGGYDDMAALERDGKLDPIIAGG
ncbi:Glutaredoxin, GrxC [Roseibacterium elongatum DSM 19469]|uniref:Glutaredoxin n=1 Tax=Roseicyclus elongatus DSM 19469 TaxID=1294273 RepID=W8RZR9_9RHOB|nr:glutaredoxin 3 [Roseibacterium elongatum]AHM03362.1 Glutaredoxin, GrxC [Roseibacterium elongatum DSM 19469]